MLFDLLGVQLNGPKAAGKHIVINWNFTDAQKVYALALEDSALTYTANKQVGGADASLTLTRDTLNAIVLRRVTVSDAIQSGQIKVTGEAGKARRIIFAVRHVQPEFRDRRAEKVIELTGCGEAAGPARAQFRYTETFRITSCIYQRVYR